MSGTKTFFSSSAFNFLTTITKVIYAMLVASLFGASSNMDTFVAAVSITMALNALLNNSQSNTLIPFLSGRESDYNTILSRVVNFNGIISFLCAVLISLLAPLLISSVAPGLQPEQKIQAAILLRILSINIILNNLGALGNAILKMDNKITTTYIFAFVNAVFSLLLLALFKKRWGVYIFPFIQITAMIPFVFYTLSLLRKKGIHINPFTMLHKETVYSYTKLLVPVLSAWLFVWVIKFSDNNIASRFASGSMSYLNYCTKVLNFAGVLPSIICSMTFPRLSKIAQLGDKEEYKTQFLDGFNKLLFLILPIGIITFSFAESIITIMYQRGSFTLEDSRTVALLIKGYILVITCAPIGSFLSNAFFAYKKPKVAMYISITSSVTNVILNIALSYFWGVLGLVIASSLSFLLGNILQWLHIKKVNNTLTPMTLFTHVQKQLTCGAIALIVGLTSTYLLGAISFSNTLGNALFRLTAGACLVAFSYLGAGILLREENSLNLLSKVRGKQ